MREIKFRAWDKDGMCYSFCVHACGWVAYMNQDWLSEESTPILMQYTGLKDKNGKDIYEGDIVGVWDDRTIKKHWKILVKFGEVDFHRDAYTNCIGFFGTEVGCSMPQGLNSALTYQRCEVIGNIYANPELLTT